MRAVAVVKMVSAVQAHPNVEQAVFHHRRGTFTAWGRVCGVKKGAGLADRACELKARDAYQVSIISARRNCMVSRLA